MDIILIKHGFLQLAIGILVGMPYLKAISKVKENKEQWRIAHLAGSLGGIMLIALGCSHTYYHFESMGCELMGYGFVISNWAFTIGLVLSGISGKRGLSPRTKSPIGLTIFGLYCFAALVSSLSTFVMIYAALKM